MDEQFAPSSIFGLGSADSVSTQLACLLPSMREFCGPTHFQVASLSGGSDPGALQLR